MSLSRTTLWAILFLAACLMVVVTIDRYKRTVQDGKTETVITSPIYMGEVVSEDVFDDGQNTAYISGDNLFEITQRKRQWERTFPSKEIKTMSLDRYGPDERLLIYYEAR